MLIVKKIKVHSHEKGFYLKTGSLRAYWERAGICLPIRCARFAWMWCPSASRG